MRFLGKSRQRPDNLGEKEALSVHYRKKKTGKDRGTNVITKMRVSSCAYIEAKLQDNSAILREQLIML